MKFNINESPQEVSIYDEGEGKEPLLSLASQKSILT